MESQGRYPQRTEELGADYLMEKKRETELRVIKKKILALTKQLAGLQARKAALEKQ